MLDLAEVTLPSELAAVSDFWLIDGARVTLMHYNPDYTFAGPIIRSIGARPPDREDPHWLSNPTRPDELSATLRRLRQEAGLSESEAAQRAPDARTHRPDRSASARLRSFHPALVIGLLQIPDYARALLSGAHAGTDLDRMVSARLARQQVLDTDRTFELLMTEGALRWHVGGPLIMAEQIEHLAQTSERPNVRVGIIPWTRPVTHPVLHGFHLYDQRAIMVSTETAMATMTDRLQIADFEARFSLYAELADWDDDAGPVLERLAGSTAPWPRCERCREVVERQILDGMRIRTRSQGANPHDHRS